MKQSQFLLNNKIGEQQHKDCVIESYYKLKKPQQLAEIALDKSECDSFFRWRKYRKYKSDKQIIQKQQELKDQAKHSANHEQFQNILTHHTKNSTNTNNKFRIILKNILQRKLLDERYRKRVIFYWTWMIASNTVLNINEQKYYYDQLKNSKDFPDYHAQSIHQDVLRTQFKQNKEELAKKLNDILVCYQRRNPTIGYCQGMNYIVTFLLDLNFTEEELFWILVEVLENILPIDYFPNFMLGLLCDLKIFNDLLKYHNNKIWKKFQEVNIDTSIILTHWLVCLFTNSAQKQVLLVIWDHLFAKGSVALFKASLLFFDICQEEILQATGVEILHKIEKKISSYDDAVTFNQKMSKLYISRKAITVLRDLYRQIFHLEIDKDQQKIRNRLRQFYLKRQNITCKQEWPICHHYLEREKVILEKDFDHFILKEKSFPPQIKNSYFSRNFIQKQEDNIQKSQNIKNENKNITVHSRNLQKKEDQQQFIKEKKSLYADETNNISDFDISHLDIKLNPNITQLERDLQIHEISQIANKHGKDQKKDKSISPNKKDKKSDQDENKQKQKNIQDQDDEEYINYDFESFLDELDLKFQAEQPNQVIHKQQCSLDELFIMRTPHICQLADNEVFELNSNNQEENPIQKYIQNIQETNGQEKKEVPPQSVEFIKMFTPREVFSDLVFRDVSSYDSDFDEL